MCWCACPQPFKIARGREARRQINWQNQALQYLCTGRGRGDPLWCYPATTLYSIELAPRPLQARELGMLTHKASHISVNHLIGREGTSAVFSEPLSFCKTLWNRLAQIDRSGYYAEMAFTLSHTKMPTLLLLFYVPLTLYYKANGLKKLSFYQDEANGAARASIPPGMLM